MNSPFIINMMFTKYLEEDMKKNIKSDCVQIKKNDNHLVLEQDSVNIKNSNIINVTIENTLFMNKIIEYFRH